VPSDSALQLKSILTRRVTQLLTSSPRQDSVQAAIIEVAQMLHRPGWSGYLVGGTLRDLLAGPEGDRHSVQPRDVDIVICGATRDKLLALFSETLVLERLTRFGGLHLFRKLPAGHRVMFDIWTLADTWGFGSKKIAPSIEEFPGTTFMNIDSCAIELWPQPGSARALFSQGFFESIADRILDVNYAPNPYPYVCVARALVLGARLQFALTRRLADFILHYSANGVEPLIEAQQSHYGFVRCDVAELDAWIRDIRRQYDAGKDRIEIAAPKARRAELWLDR
jgi:hypothetical protein